MAELIEVRVNGMVCAFCANGLEKKFKKLKGLKKVEVSLDDKMIRSEFTEKTSPGDKKLKKLIEDAGYNVAEIIRKKK